MGNKTGWHAVVKQRIPRTPRRAGRPTRLKLFVQARHEHYQKLGGAQALRKPWSSGYGKLKTTISLGL